jgi:type IV pilus assembly protein PilY1
MKIKIMLAASALTMAGLVPAVRAQTTYTENFTGPTTTNSWFFLNGACLTAGTTATTTAANPACAGLAYYPSKGDNNLRGGDTGALPDPTVPPSPQTTPPTTIGGALRFTNSYGENGAILSNFNFPLSTSGLAVSFTTVTYNGDSGGGGKDGADGISFFLQDATVAPDVGAFGGSLGYTCSNQNNDNTLRPSGVNRGYDGLEGGFIGLGIDEYGNFLNSGDNTSTGPSYTPLRIGMRGPGSTTWNWLNTNYPVQYPSALTNAQKSSAVQQACKTGLVWDWSQVAATGTGTSVAYTPTTQLTNYGAINGASSVLPATKLIAVESVAGSNILRSQATPITYNVKITTGGLLSFSYSYNGGANLNVITSQDIRLKDAMGNPLPLPANVRFGFAGSTGGSTNIHEIMCFQATPTNTSQSSAGLNQKQTAKVQIGTQVYFAFYNPATLAGSLTSQYLDQDATNPNLLSIDSNITWDASCVLTGAAAGACDYPNGPAGVITAQPWTSGTGGRHIFTWDGSTGIPFEWTNLNGVEQAALNSGDAAAAVAVPPLVVPPLAYSRLNYLRGYRSDEQTPLTATTFTGVFRDRTSVLGDIVNSSPTWVGPPSAPYPATWTDTLRGGADPMNENSGGATAYAVFAASGTGGFQTRTNVVYAGANDGFLHGFRSGNYDNGNNYVKANNDGTEVLAFMPRHIARTIQTASGSPLVYNSTSNFSDPQYGHKFDVDAPPGTGDLFYNNTWHTWLVGGLGAGGPAIYALDITDPDNTFSESTTNAQAIVRGEWTNYSTNFTCVNVTGAPPGGCSQNLGNTYGVPQIRRFHNGSWGAVFGNGFGSASGDAGIYVMLVDPNSAAITFYYLSTGKAGGNGIAYTTPADLDGDHIVDYVYAGDLLGNVWRFDLTSVSPSGWAVTPNALFTTQGGAAQPITTKLAVASVAGVGNPRVMIEFGTGQQTPLSNYAGASYSTGGQALYGIWDWNMTNWNSMSSARYASLVAGSTGPSLPAAPTAALTGISQLLAQSMGTPTAATQANTGTDYRTVSNGAPCWADNSGCTGGGRQYGWYLPLVQGNAYPTDPAVPQTGSGPYSANPMVYEQIIFSPVLDAGAFIVNTTIPPATSPIMCFSTPASGYTMALNPATGGSFNNSFFSFLDTSGKLNFLNVNSSGTNIPVSGIALGGTGSASIVVSGTQDYLITQTVSGVGAIEAVNPPGGTKGSRLTWIQRR